MGCRGGCLCLFCKRVESEGNYQYTGTRDPRSIAQDAKKFHEVVCNTAQGDVKNLINTSHWPFSSLLFPLFENTKELVLGYYFLRGRS